MTARSKIPAWTHHAIVTRHGEITTDFAFPYTFDAFVCSAGSTAITPVKVRVRRERKGLNVVHRAYEINGRKRRLCALGFSYFDSYEAARSFLIYAAEAELRSARESVRTGVRNVAACKRIPKRKTVAGGSC